MAIIDVVTWALAFTTRQVDRVVSPESRRQAWDRTVAFAYEHPVLFSFLLLSLALSSPPLLLFLAFTLCTVLLALSAALAFSLFWVGLATLLLVPVLLVAVVVAACLWAWGLTTFLVARRLHRLAGGAGADADADASSLLHEKAAALKREREKADS